MDDISNDQNNNSTSQTKIVSINVNGKEVEKEVNVRMLLSDFIRHELNLKGTHVGLKIF